MGTYEVTVGQFRDFVESQAYRTKTETDGDGQDILVWEGGKFKKSKLKPEYSWRDVGFPQTDEHPVVYVTWDDAVAFCTWLTHKEGRRYSLLTEAQWEYACRAGTTTRYHFGDETSTLGEFAWLDGSSGESTHPVGQKMPNGWGLYDMHGNAREWCADWYDASYYATSPVDDPPGPATPGPAAGTCRVVRGDSASAYAEMMCRSAHRHSGRPYYAHRDIGFRVALDVAEKAEPPKVGK